MNRQTLSAFPRWRYIARERQRGRTLQSIADELGIDVAMVHRCETKFHRERLKGVAGAMEAAISS